MSSAITHVGFADESNWNDGRYRSLGFLSLPVDYERSFGDDVQRLLCESNIPEFKWTKLSGKSERFAAKKMCDFTVEKACAGKLRLDVLVWDIEDSRHKIAMRDDVANLQRMYYHLFHNVLKVRWPDRGVWRLCPDEHTALDWASMQDCLYFKSTITETDRHLFTGGDDQVTLRNVFGIEKIQPVLSQEQPLIQLADLFAGLAVFSRIKYFEYQKWLKRNSVQGTLFQEDEPAGGQSKRSETRFFVLKYFDEICKQRKLGVSLKSKQGLWTQNPKYPINFWQYKPQRQEDKAPLKNPR